MKKAVLGLVVALASTSAFAGGYSAISYDKYAQVFGRAQGANSQQEAIDLAVQSCQNGGGYNCVVAGYAYNGYVALAVGDGGHFGSGNMHDSQWDAEQSSLEACESVTRNCSIKADASAFDYSYNNYDNYNNY